jgi:two-component system, chemotaxis family, response regulator Rcp1
MRFTGKCSRPNGVKHVEGRSFVVVDKEPSLTLHCVRKNGRRERTKLSLATLSEAREVAQRILRLGGGIYDEVDICTANGPIETVPKADASGKPSEVLLVEDNAGDALLVGQALADQPAPVHLNIARDGEQALQILMDPDYQPDLVLLDLNIPKLSGYAVLASYPRRKTTPIVVFTASQNQADVDRAYALGARDFITKPMDLDEYKSAVSGAVHKWTTPTTTETLPW